MKLSEIWTLVKFSIALIPSLIALAFLVFLVGPLLIAARWLNSEDDA